jgi:glycosyltransferase involved in cell wall biosynthesis
VTYWTGVWDPAREALSKEVESLRAALAPGAPVVSFASGNERSAFWPRRGVIRLSPRRQWLLRALGALVERLGDVTHVMGGTGSWHLLRSVGRRPVVLTAAIPGPPLEPRLGGKVTFFAAESESIAADLIRGGVPRERVRVIHPGVDLDRFSPAPLPPPKPFRIAFASTPADPAEIEPRGIGLLVELARLRPDVEVRFQWRGWGDAGAARRALEALAPTANVKINHNDVVDMPTVYREAHAVACFFSAGFGKSAPNSVIEGLACGRPALLADTCGLAGLVAAHGAGAVGARSAGALAEAVDALRGEVEERSRRARALAEATLGVRTFCAAYQALYGEAASSR